MSGKMIGELNGKGRGQRVLPSYKYMLKTENSFQGNNKLLEVATGLVIINRGNTECIKYRHHYDQKWLDCN